MGPIAKWLVSGLTAAAEIGFASGPSFSARASSDREISRYFNRTIWDSLDLQRTTRFNLWQANITDSTGIIKPDIAMRIITERLIF